MYMALFIMYKRFLYAFMQEFMQEMSQMDEKVKSLVSFGFPESKAKMAITRCGMYQH